MKQKVIVLDTETGGLDPQKHSLLQVAMMACENGKVVDKIKINIVHDTYHVTARAMEVNKIYLATHQGLTPEKAAVEIMNFVRKHFPSPAQTVGHNVSFDIGFMKVLFASQGINCDDFFSYRLLDTSSFARILAFSGVIEKAGSLGQVAEQFNIPFDESALHDALVDCDVTYKLLLEMTKLLKIPEVS